MNCANNNLNALIPTKPNDSDYEQTLNTLFDIKSYVSTTLLREAVVSTYIGHLNL